MRATLCKYHTPVHWCLPLEEGHHGKCHPFLPQEESWRETVFGQLIDRKYLDDKSTRTMAMMDE